MNYAFQIRDRRNAEGLLRNGRSPASPVRNGDFWIVGFFPKLDGEEFGRVVFDFATKQVRALCS